MKHIPEEQLIWEAYIKEADLSDVHFKGDDSVRDLAKISPEELDDEEFIEDDDEYVPDEGDLVKIDSNVGGGAGEVIELSPSGTHAIVKLVKDQEKADLEKWGYTIGCRKCKSVLEDGAGHQVGPHTEECRNRILAKMKEDEKRNEHLQASNDRITKFIVDKVQSWTEGRSSDSRHQREEQDIERR